MSESVIVVDDLRFRYFGANEPVVAGCSFEVKTGEFVLILGPSGCGKSTVCLCLNGIVPQTLEGEYSGNVWINGKKATATPVYDLSQDVGIVFQDPESQFATMTTYDELAFAPENLNLPVDEIIRRIDEAIERVGIAHLMEKNVNELSGGEKQRLALAAMLTLEPAILVFDDVTANLDPVGTKMIFDTLRELRAKGDKTILIVEHKVDELVDIVDRIIILDDRSRVVASGTPREVFYRTDPALMRRLGIWIPEVVDLALTLRESGFHDLATAESLTPTEASTVILGSGVLSTMSQEFPEGQLSSGNSSKPPAFKVNDLSFRYGKQDQLALRHASLKVLDGDFVAVVGPNGSGKTTLMKHLIGILIPPHGKAYMRDWDLSEIIYQELARRVGFVFQNPEHQMVTDKVADELAYSLKRLQLDEDEINRRVQEVAQLFRLEDVLKKNPYMLSGGEKRRLGVATMLIVGQEILILDEPTYGQDSQTAAHLMDLLQAQHAEGRTIIMVTHDMRLVAKYAREVHVLWNGETRFVGTPLELFEQSELLEQTALIPPPMFQLSKLLQHSTPHFPNVGTVKDLAALLQGERHEQV